MLVAQKNEKEEAAKQRTLTEAIRSEQRIEEINGFHKTKLPGNVNSTPFTLFLIYFFKELPLDDDNMGPESEDEPLTVSLTISILTNQSLMFSGLFECDTPSNHQEG